MLEMLSRLEGLSVSRLTDTPTQVGILVHEGIILLTRFICSILLSAKTSGVSSFSL